MSLRGNVEQADRTGILGWVREESDPANPVSIVVSIDGQATMRVLANVYRQDLEQAGIGNGRHGFIFKLEGLSPIQAHTIKLTREEDGVELPGSPVLIPATLSFDDAFMDTLSRLLIDAVTDAELEQRAAFLAQQADRLLQLRADRRARKPGRLAQRQFRVRWSGRGEPPDPEPAPRALFIDDQMPFEERDAGSKAITSHMRSFQRLGYQVVFAPANMASGPGLASLTEAGIWCCCEPWTASVEEVLRREAGGFAVIYLHRGSNTRYLPLIRHYQPRARVIYSVADLHHLRLARQSEVEQRPELLELSQRVRAAELSASRFVDSVITHSTFEAGVLTRDLPKNRVHVVPWSLHPRPTAVPFAQRKGFAFIGSYGHPPNLDAAWWLIQEVLPLVRAQDPAITCLLVGSDMPDGLRNAVGPGIEALGQVPDIAAIFDRVRLTVAPLTFGAGVKGKVLDSMAAGVPCVCSPVAAEGLELPAALQTLVADGAAALAETILRVHADEAANAAYSREGLALISANHSESRVDEAMRQVPGLRPA